MSNQNKKDDDSRYSMDEHHRFCAEVRAISEKVSDLLIGKNKKYGNAALDPLRIFSRLGPLETIKVRVDDKLSRIRTSGLDGADEDTLMDLTGYLYLLMIARSRLSTKEKKDEERTD